MPIDGVGNNANLYANLLNQSGGTVGGTSNDALAAWLENIQKALAQYDPKTGQAPPPGSPNNANGAPPRRTAGALAAPCPRAAIGLGASVVRQFVAKRLSSAPRWQTCTSMSHDVDAGIRTSALRDGSDRSMRVAAGAVRPRSESGQARGVRAKLSADV